MDSARYKAMSITPESETTKSDSQATSQPATSPPGCTGRGCAICLVIFFAVILAMIPVIKINRERAEANDFGGGTYWLHFAIYDFVLKYKHLPPPFRYPDMAGEEEERVYLDEWVEEYNKSCHPQFKERTAWFKPGEPYLGKRVAKQPDTDAKPLWSWRMIVSSYECNEQWEKHDDMNPEFPYWVGFPFPRFWESWDSEVNRICANDPEPDLGHHVCGFGSGKNTNLVAIIGPGTAFGDGKTTPMNLKDCEPDMILIVESRNSGIHWMEPRDFDIRTMPRTINAPDGSGIAGHTNRGFHVMFADGQVWRIEHTVPFEELEKFFTLDSAKQYDREKVLGPYADRKWGDEKIPPIN